ncbi:alpha/beta hydrolase [Leucobacter triazinivorans]|nr:alpha/beta hydrolase [Leucobacter triazinivorans]
MPASRRSRHTRHSRLRRIVAWTAASIGAILILAIGAFLVWAGIGRMDADPAAVAALDADPAISVVHEDGAWVMAPAEGADGTGLVFLPGAKVDAIAYAPTFRDLAAAGTTVVIPDLPLRFAILETRDLDDFAAYAPEVDRWAIGGHSLGGVRACQEVSRIPDAALILLASYCAADLSDGGAEVLSISGTNDGLSTPADIDAASNLLPPTAEMVVIDGANHAAFGWYGVQPGDGEATVSREQVAREVSARSRELIAGA